jgi:hypothetical protein
MCHVDCSLLECRSGANSTDPRRLPSFHVQTVLLYERNYATPYNGTVAGGGIVATTAEGGVVAKNGVVTNGGVVANSGLISNSGAFTKSRAFAESRIAPICLFQLFRSSLQPLDELQTCTVAPEALHDEVVKDYGPL